MRMAADVVIISKEGLKELIEQGRIDPTTAADLAQAPLGLAVRSGSPKPSIDSVTAFKQTVMRAHSISLVSTTGICMTEKLFPALGISNEVAKKINDIGNADLAKSDADLVFRPVSEILRLRDLILSGRC